MFSIVCSWLHVHGKCYIVIDYLLTFFCCWYTQVFLSSRAVYCIVFNLCDDLTVKSQESDTKVGVHCSDRVVSPG